MSTQIVHAEATSAQTPTPSAEWQRQQQEAKLVECEQVLAVYSEHAIEAGGALYIIREERLYRLRLDKDGKPYKHHDVYCREKWGITKTHANRLINFYRINATAPIGVKNEYQARQVVDHLPEPKWLSAMERVVEITATKRGKSKDQITNEDIDTKDIQAVVSEMKREAHDDAVRVAAELTTTPGHGATLALDGPKNDRIICADVLDGLKHVKDSGEKINLILTSPKYNLGMPYEIGGEKGDALPWVEYVKWLESWIPACIDLLPDAGRMAVNVPDTFSGDKDEEYIRAIDIEIIRIARQAGGKLYQRIVWDKQQYGSQETNWGSRNSPACPNARRRHEHIVVFSKGTFQRGDIVKDKIDITDTEFVQCSSSVWFCKPQIDPGLLDKHPCPWGREIPRRLLLWLTQIEDTILDPFNGSGGATLAAHLLRRRYWGIDHGPTYCRVARQRIADNSVGNGSQAGHVQPSLNV